MVDKHVYSPWSDGKLDDLLVGTGIDTVIVTGGETDACVLGAVDRGLRVILATDAVCSSADATHDALMEHIRSRFTEQLEAASTVEILREWQ